MHSLFTFALQLTLAAALFATAAAWAGPVTFSAQVEGRSDIVGVLDPTGPVVQIQTVASGLSALGTLDYFSADQVNLGNGQGSGINRFVAGDGSELFGTFKVQLVPTGDPAVLELFGDVDFTGGSGRFAGADGFAHFTGVGSFITPTTALSRFDFNGELWLVSEPASLTLSLVALAALRGLQRRWPASSRTCGHRST